LIVLVVVLGFMALEAMVLVRLSESLGWWLALWLVAAAATGFSLIREVSGAFFGRMMRSLEGDGSPLLTLLQSARTMVAGLLLILPGVISDAIAIALLLLPRSDSGDWAPARPGGSRIIEGQFRREQ
jgi:UPF0716 protein FxsA